MKFRTIARLLGGLLFFVSLSMIVPLVVSLIYGDGDAKAIAYSLGTGVAAGMALFVPFRRHKAQLSHLEGFAVVTLTWLSIGFLGALPYLFTGALPTVTDAVFESVSGFTTTGSTVFTDIESQPHGLLFWRSFTQWLGGMGIIVLGIAILPLLGVGGMQLFRAEASGPTKDRFTPRLAETAKALWKAYAILTAVETLLLWLAGMSPFDAVCHAFTTMASGGFGTRNLSIEAYGSPLIEWIVIVFMFAAGVNFALHHRALQGRPSAYGGDSEFRAFVIVIGTAVVACALGLIAFGENDASLHDTIRGSFFQVLTINTSTGFASTDFELWPSFCQFILVTLMFVGGCAGSTSGGIKTVRIVLLLKVGYRELIRLVHPNVVAPVRLGRQVVPRDVTDAVWGFFFLYMAVFALASTAITAMGYDIVTAITAVATTMGNIGPGLGAVGPLDNFAHIPMVGKWVLIACMLLGRLEIFTVVVLFIPAYWRR